MSDEIKKDGQSDDFDRLFGKIPSGSKFGACPNLTHLPDAEKERLGKKVVEHCTELIMKTYISLGISGKAGVEIVEAISKRRFRLDFFAGEPEEGGSNGNG